MKNNIIFALAILLIIGIVYLLGYCGNRSLQKNTKYTIATVVSGFHYSKTSGGAGYDFIFKLNNVNYKRTASKGKFIKNYRYLIAYDSLNPKSGILLNIEIPDSINVSPKNGWVLKDIPFKVDTLILLKQLK